MSAQEVVVAPAKAVRLVDMLDAVTAELHGLDVDGHAHDRLFTLYRRALIDAGSAVSDSLLAELARLQTAGLGDTSSVDELRVALTQLDGWLHGLMSAIYLGWTPFALREASPSSVEAAPDHVPTPLLWAPPPVTHTDITTVPVAAAVNVAAIGSDAVREGVSADA